MNSSMTGYAFLLALFAGAQAAAQAPQETANADKVIKGLSMSAPYKTGSVEYFLKHGRFPSSNAELGLAPLAENPVVARIEVSTPDAKSQTVITITYGSWAGANNVLTMTGWALPGGVQFKCGGEGSTVADELRPKACKIEG